MPHGSGVVQGGLSSIDIRLGMQGQIKIHVPPVPAVDAGLVAVAAELSAVAAAMASVAAVWTLGALCIISHHLMQPR